MHLILENVRALRSRSTAIRNILLLLILTPACAACGVSSGKNVLWPSAINGEIPTNSIDGGLEYSIYTPPFSEKNQDEHHDLFLHPTRIVVGKNDTLYRLSRQFNVPIRSIIRANALQTETIRVGQKLLIPSSCEPYCS